MRHDRFAFPRPPTIMIDLTGPQRRWSEPLLERWDQCQRAALRDPDVWSGAPRRGDARLINALSAWLGVSSDRIVVTGGARAAAYQLASSFDSVLVESPTYKAIPNLFQEMGLAVEQCDWNTITGLEAATARLVWMTSPCRNPDGASLTLDHMSALERLAADGASVVINEVYRPYARHTPIPPVHRVGSMSKSAGPGARLGWIIYPHPVKEKGLGTRRSVVTSPPTLWQRAWAYFLEADGIEQLESEHVRPASDAVRGFLDHAPNLGEFLGPWSDGPSLLLRLRAGVQESRALRELAELGVLVSEGDAFCSPTPSVRMCFTGCTHAQARQAASIVQEWYFRAPSV